MSLVSSAMGCKCSPSCKGKRRSRNGWWTCRRWREGRNLFSLQFFKNWAARCTGADCVPYFRYWVLITTQDIVTSSFAESKFASKINGLQQVKLKTDKGSLPWEPYMIDKNAAGTEEGSDMLRAFYDYLNGTGLMQKSAFPSYDGFSSNQNLFCFDARR